MLLLCLIPMWFLSLSRPNPPSLHPLLHLIFPFPSIQIVFIGMTVPVVGNSHRHARTMHCDGDIHMIMPSDLTWLQTHLDGQSPFFLSPSVWMYMSLLSKWFLNLFSPDVILQPITTPLWLLSYFLFQHLCRLHIYAPPFSPAPCWQSH